MPALPGHSVDTGQAGLKDLTTSQLVWSLVALSSGAHMAKPTAPKPPNHEEGKGGKSQNNRAQSTKSSKLRHWQGGSGRLCRTVVVATPK